MSSLLRARAQRGIGRAQKRGNKSDSESDSDIESESDQEGLQRPATGGVVASPKGTL